MTALSGTLVLIQAGNGAMPEVFTTVGGLRTSGMTLNNHAMDTSNVESGAWRQLLSGAGIQSISISGGGMFTDAASEETVRANAFAATVSNYQFIFANGDILAGPFMVTNYSRSGDYENEEIYALTLESAGNISFTSA